MSEYCPQWDDGVWTKTHNVIHSRGVVSLLAQNRYRRGYSRADKPRFIKAFEDGSDLEVAEIQSCRRKPYSTSKPLAGSKQAQVAAILEKACRMRPEVSSEYHYARIRLRRFVSYKFQIVVFGSRPQPAFRLLWNSLLPDIGRICLPRRRVADSNIPVLNLA